MSLFKTSTPNYHGDVKEGTRDKSAREPNAFTLCDWLTSLIRTPTPDYQTARDSEARSVDHEQA
ncbi:MAG: hypothetical protein MJE77_39220 [Proteobacteria bacterium]|nr:hypothetical protein [Pseudomonadota bacterium]